MRFTPKQTDRLLLREFLPSDRDSLLAFPRKPGQLKYMLFSLSTEAEVDDFLSLALSGGDDPERLEWHIAVELLPGLAEVPADSASPAGGKVSRWIGSVDLMLERSEAVEAELGYFFLEEHWGKGYAAEASGALLDFAFDSLGLHRVWGKCHTENRGSARVMEKLGMKREGTVREHAWMGDHWRSSYLYGILDREWPR